MNKRGIALPALKHYREMAALTQDELADLADISRTTIIKAEAGRTVRASTVRHLSNSLDVRPRQLTSPIDCPQCGQERPRDERVRDGMKCADCAGYVG